MKLRPVDLTICRPVYLNILITPSYTFFLLLIFKFIQLNIGKNAKFQKFELEILSLPQSQIEI